MKKNGWISIYVLLLLLFLSTFITFVLSSIEDDSKRNEYMYEKIQNDYDLESVLNITKNDYGEKIKEDIKKFFIEGYINNFSVPNYNSYLIMYISESNKEVTLDKFLINYKGIDFKVYLKFHVTNFKKIFEKNNGYLYIEVKKDTQNTSSKKVDRFIFKGYDLIPFEKTKPVILNKDDFSYDLIEDLDFKSIKLSEVNDLIIDDLPSGNSYLKINSDIEIPNLKNEINNNFNEFHEDEIYYDFFSDNYAETSKLNKEIDFNGILVLEGNIFLNSNFKINGLLIIKDGDVISHNNSKLIVNGQIISNKEINLNNIEMNLST
ncbi:MAG: hypothetical protein MRZ81_06895, partial [Peptoniphilaceae bacterium]|nr:hypothetical protein [Peptoniphilaceae bacterium]